MPIDSKDVGTGMDSAPRKRSQEEEKLLDAVEGDAAVTETWKVVYVK